MPMMMISMMMIVATFFDRCLVLRPNTSNHLEVNSAGRPRGCDITVDNVDHHKNNVHCNFKVVPQRGLSLFVRTRAYSPEDNDESCCYLFLRCHMVALRFGESTRSGHHVAKAQLPLRLHISVHQICLGYATAKTNN